MRRVGRTARGANGTGLVSVLVVVRRFSLTAHASDGHTPARLPPLRPHPRPPVRRPQGRQVAIAQEIMARNARGAPVERLPEDAQLGSS